MQAFLFESPILLTVTVLFIQLLLTSAWLRRRTAVTRRLALIGLIVFPLMIVIQALVATQRERVEAVCEALKTAVEKADTPGFERHLSDRLVARRARGGALSKEELIQRFTTLVQSYHVEDARLHNVAIEITGRSATVDLRATCRVVAQSEIHHLVPSHWVLVFEREGDDWRLSEVRQATVQPVGLDILGDLP